MSPLFLPIILLIAVGIVLFAIGLFRREKRLLIIGAPAVLIVCFWLIEAGSPPNAKEEFGQLFGANLYGNVTNIKSSKPLSMNGHFMSFEISPDDFDQLIAPQLIRVEFTNFHILRGQDLPTDWPEAIENASSALYKKSNYNEVLVIYDSDTHLAYVSVQYDKW